MLNTRLADGLEAIKVASGIIADRVFEAHAHLEGEAFLEYRDKAVGLISFLKDEAKAMEEELERVKAVLAEDEEEEKPLNIFSNPNPDPEPLAVEPEPEPDAKSDVQKKLDDLMNQVTKGTSSYPAAFLREEMPDELKKQLSHLKKNGVIRIGSTVLQDLSDTFKVSKIAIVKYYGWYQR